MVWLQENVTGVAESMCMNVLQQAGTVRIVVRNASRKQKKQASKIVINQIRCKVEHSFHLASYPIKVEQSFVETCLPLTEVFIPTYIKNARL